MPHSHFPLAPGLKLGEAVEALFEALDKTADGAEQWNVAAVAMMQMFEIGQQSVVQAALEVQALRTAGVPLS